MGWPDGYNKPHTIQVMVRKKNAQSTEHSGRVPVLRLCMDNSAAVPPAVVLLRSLLVKSTNTAGRVATSTQPGGA